jgi:peptide deformylase
MSLLKIAKLGHPVIRAEAVDVSCDDLETKETQNFIDSMIATMRDANGVGIAAPQVHVPKRIIIVEVRADNPRYPQQKPVPLTIIVNPVITEHSQEMEGGWEGCLSIPDMRGIVPRWTSLSFTGLDRRCRPYTDATAHGFFARVIQHEIDHLNGNVFLDRLPDLSSLTHLSEYQRHGTGNP